MVYTARIDVAPIRDVVIVTVLSLAILLAAVILGQEGPDMNLVDVRSSYGCPDYNHYHICPGGVNVGQSWSQKMIIETRQLNKHWYLIVLPYGANDTDGISEDVQIFTMLQGKKYTDPWNTLLNQSEISHLDCEGSSSGTPFYLIYEESIDYDLYMVSVRMSTLDNQPLLNLADVEFYFVKDNPEYSKMALIMKVLFLGISIAMFAFHYLKLKGNRTYWESWTDEQRLFVFLLLGLVCLNNPFFPLEYIVKGWFLLFFGSFLEIIFSCALFSFWFIIAQKLRSSEYKLEFTRALKVSLGLVALYGVISSIFELLVNIREGRSPLFGVGSQPSAAQVMYYFVVILYLGVVIVFFASLVVTIQPINNKLRLKARFVFFAVPTVFVILSLSVGVFFGIVGPYGRSTPSFVYYLVMYNLYVYYLLWGYWPVEVVLAGPTPSVNESTKMFIQATTANYGIE